MYPDYASIIPRKFTSYLRMGRADLISAIKSAAVVSSKLNDVTFEFHENEIEVRSINPEVGKTSIMKKAHVQTSGIISFNYRYLLDGLESLSSEKVLIGLQDENASVLIQDPDDVSFLYVLMPIRNL